ncbi:MAG: hypothetical protein IAF02_10785 [Anaerolineae bacterium]|nr:hypothetical protein [Anaerolineae bacterium]
MQGIYTYHVEVQDEVDEAVFNAASPIQVQGVRLNGANSRLIIYADQSGLIGLIRHLHQQGFVLLSVFREPFFQEKGNENSNRR